MAKPTELWFPMYVNDYLGDTLHLNTRQHGAYMLLILAYWKRQGPLPADDARLAAITKLTPQEFAADRAVLLEFFREVGGTETGGLWVHARIDAEIDRAKAFHEKQRENGAKGGRPIANHNPNKTHGVPHGHPQSQSHTQLELQQEPPLTPQGEVGGHKAKFEEARKLYPGTKRGLEAEWSDFTRKHGKRLSEVLPLLVPGIQEGITYRQDLTQLRAKFVPQWKNFKTWLHQGCWEERFPEKVIV